MSDLISRQDAVDAVLNLSEKVANEMLFIDAIVDEIENIPSAEPERKKGRWKNVALFTRECSECGAQFHELEYDNFCPNCGAEMRGE